MNSAETSLDPTAEKRAVAPPPQRERVSQQEIKKRSHIEKAATLLDLIMDKYLREEFSENTEPRERLPFHNERHTRSIIDRTRAILKAMQDGGVDLTDDDIARGAIAAASHDLIQRWEENPVQEQFHGQTYTKIMRKRFVGANETASIEKAIGFVDDLSIPDDAKESIRQALRDAIPVTVPGFNPEKATVVQPGLTPESSPIARALALADIGDAGVDPDAFLRAGDTLFREENLDMLDLKDRLARGDVPEDQQSWYKDRILRWAKFQPRFAEGRRALLDTECGNLPEQAKGNICTLFSKFDNSIDGARDVARRREEMTLQELLDDMGY